MSTSQLEAQAAEYERRAHEAEVSPVPAIIQISKVVVWIFYVVILLQAILLTVAFFLRLFGANPDAGFAEWVYRSSETLMGPFRGLFPDRQLSDQSVLDLSLLTAAAVYFLVAFAFDLLLHWLRTQLWRQRRAIAEARSAANQAAQQVVTAPVHRGAGGGTGRPAGGHAVRRRPHSGLTGAGRAGTWPPAPAAVGHAADHTRVVLVTVVSPDPPRALQRERTCPYWPPPGEPMTSSGRSCGSSCSSSGSGY